MLPGVTTRSRARPGAARVAIPAEELPDTNDRLVRRLDAIRAGIVLAWLVSEAGIETLGDGLVLGLILWIGFPLVLWVGAMIWEATPWRLAAVHGGDWLVKLLALSAIVSVWS